mgnify:CR=1 FL=1
MWASLQYEKGICLENESSFTKNPEKSLFTLADMKNFKQQVKKWDAEKKGDLAYVILQK